MPPRCWPAIPGSVSLRRCEWRRRRGGRPSARGTAGRGERAGSRQEHVRGLLCRLTGAEDALAVNNNAAAVLLSIATLAAAREVIIARGQLVEIGGSFRIPDVIRQSGARLVEVGTTNKVRASDYESGVTGETALLLR